MNGNRRLTVFCCYIAGLTSAAFGHPYEPRMFWVPLGADPSDYPSGTTVVLARPGDTVPMSLYAQGPDGMDMLANSVLASFTTTLSPVGGPVQSGQVIADCPSAAIDTSHPDFVGFGTTLVFAEADICPSIKARFVLFNSFAPFNEVLPGNPDGVYFGQIDFIIGADACGEFVSTYIGAPYKETMITDDNDEPDGDVVFDVLQINVIPPNDLCENATVVSDGYHAYDATCGGQDGPTPSCAAPGADVFFEYTTTCHGETWISLSGFGDFAVYDDGCTLGHEIACDSSFISLAGETFIIQVIGDDARGELDIACIPIECTPGRPAGDPVTHFECDYLGWPPLDQCMMWYCDLFAGGCVMVWSDPNDPTNTTNGDVCNDDLFCTVNDACQAGVCSGDARDCADDALCTYDTCCEEPGDSITGTPFTCANAHECVSIDVNDIPCTTLGECPPEADDCIDGFCYCLENPALCLTVETQPGKNCLADAGVGDEVVVTVEMAFSTAPICAAQFFLGYDTSALNFVSTTPGGGVFNTVLLEEVDDEAGTIDYIVGDNPGAICFGTNGPATVATIVFIAKAQCKNEGVCFRGHNPPTILGAANGDGICPLYHLRPDGSCGLLDNPMAEPCCTGPFSIDITGPEMNCPDFKTFGNADCGAVTRTVYWDQIWAVDKCDGAIPVECTISHNGGVDVQHLLDKKGGPFPPGITTIDCSETCDACNNCVECIFSVGNSGLNGIHLEVELSPTLDAGPLNRGIWFTVSDCGGAPEPPASDPQCVDVSLGFPFNIPGHGTAQAKVPPGNWMCIEAWDPLHTLNATCGLTCEYLPQKGSVWFASFKGSKDLSDTCHWLVNGNINGDTHIDVLDYVTYLSCVLNKPISLDPNTYCDTEGPHCDINGDGMVSLLDFSFIMVNLFNDAKAGCEAVCSPSGTPQEVTGGVEEISVRALIASGVDSRVARTADVNNDGRVNVTDMTLYVNGGTDDMVRDQSIKGSPSVRGLR